ncbi:MAG TPA: lectin [Rhodanobacter sp.]
MKRVMVALSCALALSACSVEPPPAATTNQGKPKSTMTAAQQKALEAQDTLASYAGYGATRFGMNEAMFRAAWQADLVGTIDPAGDCSLLQPAWEKTLANFDFMFQHGQFVRYDVGTAKEIAPGGGKVGMNVEQIRALYGSGLQVSPHKYRQNEQYLRIADGKESVLLFETDTSGHVSRWRVGIPPQVDNGDGCL